MTDGLEDLAKMFKIDFNAAELDKERKVQEQRLIDAKSGDLWQQFKNAMKMSVDTINAKANVLKLTVFPKKGDQESVQVMYDRRDSKTPRQTVATYTESTHTMRVQRSGAGVHEYSIIADGAGVTFGYESVQHDPAEIAKDMLEQLLQK